MRERNARNTPMTVQERLENFWYYYKVHTIVAIIAVAIGAYLFATSRQSGPPAALQVEIIGESYILNQTEFQKVESRAAVALFGQEGAKHKGVSIDQLPMSGSLTNPGNDQMLMSVMARLSAGALDVMVLDKNSYRYFEQAHILQKLSPVSALSPLVGRHAAAGGYGLMAADSPQLAGFHFASGSVVAVVTMSKNKPLAYAFLRWLYS